MVMEAFCCSQCKKEFSDAGWVEIHLATYHRFADIGVSDPELCCALLEDMVEMPAGLFFPELGVN